MARRVKASRGMVLSGVAWYGKGGSGLLFAYRRYSATSCCLAVERS